MTFLVYVLIGYISITITLLIAFLFSQARNYVRLQDADRYVAELEELARDREKHKSDEFFDAINSQTFYNFKIPFNSSLSPRLLSNLGAILKFLEENVQSARGAARS